MSVGNEVWVCDQNVDNLIHGEAQSHRAINYNKVSVDSMSAQDTELTLSAENSSSDWN